MPDDLDADLELLLESIVLFTDHERRARTLARGGPLSRVFDRTLQTILAKARLHGDGWLRQNDESYYHIVLAAMSAWEARYTPALDIRESLLRSGFASLVRARKLKDQTWARVHGEKSARIRNANKGPLVREFAREADLRIKEMQTKSLSRSEPLTRAACARAVFKVMDKKRPKGVPDGWCPTPEAMLQLIRRQPQPW